MTMTLLICGFGYTGEAMARLAAAHGHAVAATSRDPSRHPTIPRVRIVPFDDARSAIDEATHLVSTAPPPGDCGDGADGTDPVLQVYHGAIIRAPRLRWLGYLSTTGVYGDRDGGWVDEDTEPAPGQERSRRRLAAEHEWSALADRLPVDLFRVAGIYGPGRSPLDEVRRGRARRIVKPGHCFGRIHRDDIAGAVLAATAQDRSAGARVLHLSDDFPATTAEVTEEAARLLGVSLPPPVPFEEARTQMSPIGLSFWQENRKVASAKTQRALGRKWLYPSYREGLRAILAEQSGDRPAQQGDVGRT